ncbi:MAG TPA: response regulator [Thermoanaerobaculia bacterium]|nr:response regulator [Thermoanaerobaculia bacterium]
MPKRILLADDSITIQKVVELTFSDGDYEVTAVNNGARAILKLADMKPDIILSDIIMPEKNGYEVCEYVKSHPEYRNIPVVLLTGTFEPFDPDRAEKAGCDAVVTKPFESQSLIHKVEELIAQAQSAAAAPPPPPAPEPVAAPAPPPSPSASPWLEDEPAPPPPSPFSTSSGSLPAISESYTHGSDIFGATSTPEATTEMPFEPPSGTPFGGGETRAFPRMSFDDLQQTAPAPPPAPPAPEPSPWDEQDFGGETRAFGKMTFDDLQSMQQPLEPQHPAATEFEPEPETEAESPFGAPPPAEEFSSETRAFGRISFDDLQRQMSMPAPEPEPEPQPEPQAAAPAPEPPALEASPWDEPAETPFGGGATQAFPAMSFDDFTPAAPQPEPQAETSPWDEQPSSFADETQSFPKMSFDDLAASAPLPEPEPEPLAASEPEPAPWEEPSEPAWAPEPEPAETAAAPQEMFATAAYASLEAPQPGREYVPEPEAEQPPMEMHPTAEPELEELPTVPAPEEPAWSPIPAAEAEAEPAEPVVPPPALAPETPSLPIRSAELSDEQVDRIARRVVELMSDQVVRNIAWEVIPDLAEMVVKERIRQLESEA